MVGKTVIPAERARWAEQLGAWHGVIAGTSGRWASLAQPVLPLQDFRFFATHSHGITPNMQKIHPVDSMAIHRDSGFS